MTTLTLSRLPSAPAMNEKPETIFSSAHAALVFALNYSMQQYDRPLMNKAMSGRPHAEGKGLSGIDGAGQAGMIRATLARLLPLHQAVLVAGAAPSQTPCECFASCCAGWKVNPEWLDAMSQVTTAAAAGALSGCVSNGRLRSALIQRLFGVKVSLAEIAERFDVSERTAEAHSGKLKRWLFGARAKGDHAAEPGLHQAAYGALEAALRAGTLIN